jgi:arylsulfatase A-like enzyme
MTFQAVAVQQKVPTGGYLDSAGTPSALVQSTFKHIDESIGKIVSELKAQKLLDSTLLVVTSVHGDSPILRSMSRKLSEDLIPEMIGEELVAVAIQDTEALLWLKDQSQTAKVAALLSRPENRAKAAINEIVWGETLKLQYNDPLKDGRVPDIIVKPLVGVYYASDKSTKVAEHGGFYTEDVNVPLLLANPKLKGEVIKVPVPTTSLAPTILKVLGLDPQALESVKMEKTPLLPEF